MIARALGSLRPKESWILDGDTYSGLKWLEPDTIAPTQAEIEAEIIRLKALDVANAHKGKRAAEYPPMADYMDAVVKGDTVQQQAYIDACLAVKAKWPKP